MLHAPGLRLSYEYGPFKQLAEKAMHGKFKQAVNFDDRCIDLVTRLMCLANQYSGCNVMQTYVLNTSGN